MEDLNNWIIATNDFIWTYILIALLICIGVYFTFKSNNFEISGKCSVYLATGL